jgi:hypothetical protein
MVDCLVAIGPLPLAAVETEFLGLPPYRCPYRLPFIDGGETLIVVSSWLKRLREQGLNTVEQVLIPLKKRFDRIIGLDHADPFLLDFDEPTLQQFDAVIKVHGLFRDPDLYNYVVGAVTPDGKWTEKEQQLTHFRSPESLQKLNLGIPCFLSLAPLVRQHTRPFYTRSRWRQVAYGIGDRVQNLFARPASLRSKPRLTTHFYASLTHGQRATAARALAQSSLPWTGGITNVPPFVQGLAGIGITELSNPERERLREQFQKDGILAPKLNRLQYQISLLDAKAVLSITGFGELCFRQAEAWANGRILVCQDLSHVNTLYPLQPGRNVVYCRPDLSNLVEVLEDIECNYHQYRSIAEQGFEDWLIWSSQALEVLTQGFQPIFSRS